MQSQEKSPHTSGLHYFPCSWSLSLSARIAQVAASCDADRCEILAVGDRLDVAGAALAVGAVVLAAGAFREGLAGRVGEGGGTEDVPGYPDLIVNDGTCIWLYYGNPDRRLDSDRDPVLLAGPDDPISNSGSKISEVTPPLRETGTGTVRPTSWSATTGLTPVGCNHEVDTGHTTYKDASNAFAGYQAIS